MIALLLAFIEVTLSWQAPENSNPPVSSYNVYQDGVRVATVVPRSYVQNVDFSTAHCWRVTALNAAGESIPSEQLCLGKPQAPAVPSAAFPG